MKLQAFVGIVLVANSIGQTLQQDAAAPPAAPASRYKLNGWFPCSLYTDEPRNKTPAATPAATPASQTNSKTRRFSSLLRELSIVDEEYERLRKPYYVPSMSSRSHLQRRLNDEKEETDSQDDEEEDDVSKAECGMFELPFCYSPKLCKDATRKIQSFVKRIPANSTNTTGRPKALWVLQGGPGASSISMESLMEEFYQVFKQQVSIYTLDHRGTGRSEYLDCKASQATTPGSPGGKVVTASELPHCIKDLRNQYGDNAGGFSVTSAAKDIASIIEDTQADMDVYVYGLSYGTALVERVMHLRPKYVKGYILDSVQSEYYPDWDNGPTFSNWDREFGSIGLRFLDYCSQNEACSGNFHKSQRNLTETLRGLYQELDSNKHVCSSFFREINVPPAVIDKSVKKLYPEEKASYPLRKILGILLMSFKLRNLIPVVIYRALRCDKNDQNVIENIYHYLTEKDDDMSDSDLLYDTIVFSEMWEHPTRSIKEAVERFENSIMTDGLYDHIPTACMFMGDTTGNCANITKTDGFIYPVDEYWNKTTSIPNSVLVFAGLLDPQTPEKFAKTQFELMTGGEKMIVEFDYSSHVAIDNTPVKTEGEPMCGVTIIKSYLDHDGNVSAVDTSCRNEIKPISFELPTKFVEKVLNVSNAYDGQFSANDESSKSSYKTAFTVVAIFLALAVLLIGFLGYRLSKLKKSNAANSKPNVTDNQDLAVHLT